MQPITPAEAAVKKAIDIPPEVIEAFNNLISKNFPGGRAHVVQDDVIAEILSIMNGPATCGIVDHVPVTRNDIFAKKRLDVEPIFEKAGWEVSYDSPAYCENYRAYFIFKQK